MPLLDLNQNKFDSVVYQMLEESGISVPKETSLLEKLESHGLNTEDCIAQLADIAKNGDPRDGIRLRAIETGLKLNGVLKESERPAMPAFTIVINDNAGPTSTVNPILIPRVTVEQVN